ncbi:MAG: 30S ribosome-binding factor RbfA [Phycisphaerales bacterium]
MSHKHEHLESSIDRAIREVISRGFNDPRISGLITVTGVRVTPDHTTAFVDVSILPEERSELTMHGLTAAARHIRREVGELVRTRQMPELHFRLDRSLKRQASVLEALDRAKEQTDSEGQARGTWSHPAEPHEGRGDEGGQARGR